jgi:hypothetical protein
LRHGIRMLNSNPDSDTSTPSNCETAASLYPPH